MSEGFRSGFACFVGRPNAGKSTLTNALVGQKIAIASSKPQTTRHAVRGIVTRPEGQLVLIDTPGLHKPRTLLGERLNDLVRDTWSEVDVIGVCLPCDQRIGPGDKYIIGEIAALESKPKLVALATKTDTVSNHRVLSHLVDVAAAAEEIGIEWADVVPCSATAGHQVDVVRDVLLGLMPEGPAYYPDGESTDEPEETLIAELMMVHLAQGDAVVAIGLILVLTMLISSVVNNAATAAAMCPIALGTAASLGVSADAFLMAVAIGASCAFLTPIGHQNNTLILGPGGFRFGDYWLLGLPVSLLVVVVSIPLLLLVWPL